MGDIKRHVKPWKEQHKRQDSISHVKALKQKSTHRMSQNQRELSETHTQTKIHINKAELRGKGRDEG